MGGGSSKKLPDHKRSKEEIQEAENLNSSFRSMVVSKIDNDDFRKFYDTQHKKTLGKGMTGTVFQVTHKQTGQPFAAKTVRIRRHSSAMTKAMLAEIKLLSQMDHPNIVKLVKVYKDNFSLTMIMEVCSGGELFDGLMDMGEYSQQQAATLFKQMVSAVNYCHRMGIAHRDLKLENFVFSDNSRKALKLIDFGLSRRYGGGGGVMKMKSLVGTGYYMAPEVLNSQTNKHNKYGEKCDVWSLGVILFMMLTGMPPFDGQNDTQIMDNIRKNKMTRIDPKDFDYPEARDLLKGMLNVDISKRLSCEQVLQHPWFKMFGASTQAVQIAPGVVKSMCKFARLENMKKMALEAVTTSLTATEIKTLSENFRSFDTDGSGHISISEFRNVLGKQMNDDESKELFEMIDTDHTGLISYSEFISSTLFHQDLLTPERLMAAFDRLDPDKSGYIEAAELANILPGMSKTDVEKMISEVDKVEGETQSPDGKISKAEFISMIPKM